MARSNCTGHTVQDVLLFSRYLQLCERDRHQIVGVPVSNEWTVGSLCFALGACLVTRCSCQKLVCRVFLWSEAFQDGQVDGKMITGKPTLCPIQDKNRVQKSVYTSSCLRRCMTCVYMYIMSLLLVDSMLQGGHHCVVCSATVTLLQPPTVGRAPGLYDHLNRMGV